MAIDWSYAITKIEKTAIGRMQMPWIERKDRVIMAKTARYSIHSVQLIPTTIQRSPKEGWHNDGIRTHVAFRQRLRSISHCCNRFSILFNLIAAIATNAAMAMNRND